MYACIQASRDAFCPPPLHEHPLSEFDMTCKDDCFHCKLPIHESGYGCERCNFYIHKFCNNLPETMRHPLHHQHPLTLLTLFDSSDAPTSNLCNKCREPCLRGFAYHCRTCRFILHLGCCFILDHEKHNHPLHFGTPGVYWKVTSSCKICDQPVRNFYFSCGHCRFVIHYDCSMIPPTIKHHHTHELAIRHHFPKECDQVYCDRCEDRYGELDRTLSYYYCKGCDYIAHVICVAQPEEANLLFKRFTHEHPSILHKGDHLCCNQCDFSVAQRSTEYPSLIKHPRHQEHTLTYVEKDLLSKCTDCDFTLDDNSTFQFTHPYFGWGLQFCTKTEPFRCDACGELGNGSRMSKASENSEDFDSYSDNSSTEYSDFHLECFALPGKLKHESHPCHLYLSLNPAKDSPSSQYCNVCTKEIDEIVCVYCCLDCDYVAHLACVANDLLSTLRSSIKNEPGFCAIIEPDNTSFELHIAKIDPSSSKWPPEPLLRKPVKSDEDNDAKRFAGIITPPLCHYVEQLPTRTEWFLFFMLPLPAPQWFFTAQHPMVAVIATSTGVVQQIAL